AAARARWRRPASLTPCPAGRFSPAGHRRGPPTTAGPHLSGEAEADGLIPSDVSALLVGSTSRPPKTTADTRRPVGGQRDHDLLPQVAALLAGAGTTIMGPRRIGQRFALWSTKSTSSFCLLNAPSKAFRFCRDVPKGGHPGQL